VLFALRYASAGESRSTLISTDTLSPLVSLSYFQAEIYYYFFSFASFSFAARLKATGIVSTEGYIFPSAKWSFSECRQLSGCRGASSPSLAAADFRRT